MDRPRSTRPLYERVILIALGIAAVGAALAGLSWLWSQSDLGAGVRDASPSWTPDGRIVFSSGAGGKADLWVVDRSGDHRVALMKTAADEGGAAWSPDGSQVAFHSNRDGNYEIYVMPAGGGRSRRLTSDPAIDQAPAWSPDGRQLVFMSNRADAGFDIFRMNADGSGAEPLTHGGSNGFPQYSPDGGQLALQVGRDVYVMSLSSRALRRLTSEPADGLYPTWSPDGLRIAFMSGRNGCSEIFTVRTDGTDPRVVVTMPNGDAVDPRWSPDSRYIAFVHVPDDGATRVPTPNQQRIVYVVDLETGKLTRVSR